MPPSAFLPVHERPRLAYCWKSVHGDIERQAFVVNGLWGMHLYRYSGEVRMNGSPMRFESGWAGFTPPDARMAYTFRGHCVHVFAHFEWPGAPAPSVEVPFLFPVGAEFALLWDRMEEANGWFHSDPLRSEVRVWDVMLSLVDASKSTHGSADLPHVVRRALAIIEGRLAEPLSVQQIAEECLVSHNHLTRLFKAKLGDTVIGTIQRRRVERARHLLERSTMPVKEVACLVGLPDLQHFNKSVRRILGASPTVIRNRRNEST